MRIASKLERKSLGLSPKAKFYIIPEGDKTEIQYFSGIINNAQYLNIDKLIEIILVENEEKEHGQSHPLKKFKNFNEGIKKQEFIYYEGLDKVCFVFDRDKQSFKENQFDELLQNCKEKGYKIYISNPCFELFLLMHSDRIFELNKKELLANRKVNSNKKFLEVKLSEFFGCNKKNINFNKFKPYIGNAIKNEKHFNEDINKLKEELGSNVGKLLEELIEKNSKKEISNENRN